MATQRPTPSSADIVRFWSKVSKTSESECWIWTSDLNSKGYGRLEIWRHGRRWRLLAHRLSYEMANNTTLRPGLVVRHSCDNPPCVNPAHLSIGTQADNLADMRARGRQVEPPVKIGTAHPASKLTDDDVREIRMWLGLGYPQRTIAATYGVSQKVVGRIHRGTAWSHVEPYAGQPAPQRRAVAA